MKSLKTLAAMFVVSLLALNLAIACGGMSPQPAPGDFDTDVPSLPSTDNLPGPGDGTDTTTDSPYDTTTGGGDTTTGGGDLTTNGDDDNNDVPHDCPFPGDLNTPNNGDNGQNNGDNSNNDNYDLSNLPSDLPAPKAGDSQNEDRQFVDIVL